MNPRVKKMTRKCVPFKNKVKDYPEAVKKVIEATRKLVVSGEISRGAGYYIEKELCNWTANNVEITEHFVAFLLYGVLISWSDIRHVVMKSESWGQSEKDAILDYLNRAKKDNKLQAVDNNRRPYGASRGRPSALFWVSDVASCLLNYRPLDTSVLISYTSMDIIQEFCAVGFVRSVERLDFEDIASDYSTLKTFLLEQGKLKMKNEKRGRPRKDEYRNFYTCQEVAECLQLHRNTVYKLIRQKKLEAKQNPNGRWEIPLSALNALFLRN